MIIVGGGIMGLSIALELRRTPELDVLVLERAIPGAEASSAAAGMLAPQFEASTPGPMFELSLRSRSKWPSWAAELEERSGVNVGYRACGGVQLAFTQEDLEALRTKVAWQSAHGVRAELMSNSALHESEPAVNSAALAGAAFPDEHQVEPRKLLRALLVATTRAGAVFRSGTVRTLLETEGVIRGVDVDGEHLEGDLVILAAGAWSAQVRNAGIEGSRIKPVRGQMMELQLRAPLFSRLLKSSKGYLVPRPDGSVLVGSTMEMVGFDKNVTAEGLSQLLSAAIELVPGLARANVSESWAGLRPWTNDQLPFLGEGPKRNLLLATGHFRNGILLAPITASLVGQLVRGEKPLVDLQPFRYQRSSP